MRISAECVERSGRRRHVALDCSADTELQLCLRYISQLNRMPLVSSVSKAKRIRALRRIGRALGREIAEIILDGGSVLAHLDAGPVHLSEVVLHAAVDIWTARSVKDVLRRLHTCNGEFRELIPGVRDGDLDTWTRVQVATPGRTGIVIVSHDRCYQHEVTDVMEAATAIGVAVVEITSIKAASRWRRPDLLVVAHAKRPGYVQAIDTELNVRQDILEKYCMGEASQIDLCICNSRSDFAFSQTAFDRALIRARTGFTRLDRVCQSILEMLAPVNARALLGDASFAYLDGRMGFSTVRNLIYSTIEADTSLQITEKTPGWTE